MPTEKKPTDCPIKQAFRWQPYGLWPALSISTPPMVKKSQLKTATPIFIKKALFGHNILRVILPFALLPRVVVGSLMGQQSERFVSDEITTIIPPTTPSLKVLMSFLSIAPMPSGVTLWHKRLTTVFSLHRMLSSSIAL